MHFRREAAKKFLCTFFYAFRAKREKIFKHFFKHLCCFPQTLKKTLLHTTALLPRFFAGSGNSELSDEATPEERAA